MCLSVSVRHANKLHNKKHTGILNYGLETKDFKYAFGAETILLLRNFKEIKLAVREPAYLTLI